MAYIDVDAVLNQNPSKRLRIGFEKLKSNYTTEAATEYMDLYKDQPLSFLLENSRYIFSEPQYGYDFYKESMIENPKALLFTEYENEKEKIENYLESFQDQMPEEQKTLYTDLLSIVTEKCEESKNIAVVLSHAFDKDEKFQTEYVELANAYFDTSKDAGAYTNPERVAEILYATESADLFYALSPFITHVFRESMIAENLPRFYHDCVQENAHIDKDEWKHFIESTIIVGKLSADKIYTEAVSCLSKQNRMVFQGLATESVRDQIDELSIIHVTESAENTFNTMNFSTLYPGSSSAVNQIFDDYRESHELEYIQTENASFKSEREELKNIAEDLVKEYVTCDYFYSENTDSPITGYDCFTEGTSIEDAFGDIVVEAESTYSQVKNDQPKKEKAPSPKNLANKVQFKAMDAEAKQIKSMATAKQKGQEVKNAVKAVAAIPNNIIKSIKDTVNEWNKMDERKREEYMMQPGYRKKIIRNFKLACLYGSVASMKLAYLPFVFIFRHFDKQKSLRVRSSLAKDLETELKIMDEKINDASNENDREKKYQLMRMKSELEKEAIRVRTNSKYI